MYSIAADHRDQRRGAAGLSTDGLHRSMTAEQLKAVLNAYTTVSGTARALVKAALDTGGRDNITGLIARVS